MDNAQQQWVAVVQELGAQIGSLSVQLASANVRIKELERVIENGITEKHDQRNSTEGSSRTADADADTGEASSIR